MGVRVILLLLSFYFILNMLAGLVLHCATLADCSVSPTMMETAVYFVVFGCLGAPLVVGTVMWHSRWHASI